MNTLDTLTKSKQRIRDHGEVFTPDWIVDAMLDLVKSETERIESKFLEPACGNGNFLIKILSRKLAIINKRYKKIQSEFEFYTILALGSIYGIDLLEDNIIEARTRLSKLTLSTYHKRFKKKNVNPAFEQLIDYILEKNLIQGNALSLENGKGEALVFSERSGMSGYKIKRRTYIFEQLIPQESGKEKTSAFIPKPISEYPPCHFLSLSQQGDDHQSQPRCIRSTSKSQQ